MVITVSEQIELLQTHMAQDEQIITVTWRAEDFDMSKEQWNTFCRKLRTFQTELLITETGKLIEAFIAEVDD